MCELYAIYTKNNLNKVLIFPTKAAAVAWAEKATTWTPEEIEKKIRPAQPLTQTAQILSE